MERRWRAVGGYVAVMIGAVAFVVGCFLPFFDYEVSPLGSVSVYRLTMFGRGELAAYVGGVLSMFAGVATLAWVAIAGVRGSGGWMRPALTAVTIAWSLTSIGLLLGVSQLASPPLVGYWVMLLGIVVVVIGTILVWVSARADVAKVDGPAS